MRGHCDDQKPILPEFLLAQADRARGFLSVHFRHRNISEKDVWCPVRRYVHRFLSIFRKHKIYIQGLDQLGKHKAVCLVVLGCQNPEFTRTNRGFGRFFARNFIDGRGDFNVGVSVRCVFGAIVKCGVFGFRGCFLQSSQAFRDIAAQQGVTQGCDVCVILCVETLVVFLDEQKPVADPFYRKTFVDLFGLFGMRRQNNRALWACCSAKFFNCGAEAHFGPFCRQVLGQD